MSEHTPLVLRGDSEPTYITGIASESIPSGARFFLDTATGRLTRERPQPPRSGALPADQQESPG